MDIQQQIRAAVETGKVVYGSEKTIEALLTAEPKMVVLSSDCPQIQKESINYYCTLANVPQISVKENAIDFGSSVGRPHPVAAMTILEEGESTILEAAK
jgi:large subunit ribosomal protein L30e